MKFRHNDIDIDVLDNGTFKAKVNGAEIFAPSLIAMKNKINRTQPFKPFDAFFLQYNEILTDVVVVGMQKDRRYSLYLWKTRCGRTLGHVWRDTPATRAAAKKYMDAVVKHAKIRAANEKIEGELKEAIGEQVTPNAPQ